MYYDKVIEIYRQTGYSARKIEKLGIVPVSHHAIQDWINNFLAENEQPFIKIMKETIKEQDSEEVKALKKRVNDYEEKLRLANMHFSLDEKMIELAEKRFKIEIRKKPGAKQ
jgi:hypothetical protein